MEVCWEERCKTKDKPICCVDCEEKEGCSEYCELCFDKAELEKYKRCPPDCPDRTTYTEDESEQLVNCHKTCRGYLFRVKQNEKKRQQKEDDKIYSSFKFQSVTAKKAKVNRKKG